MRFLPASPPKGSKTSLLFYWQNVNLNDIGLACLWGDLSLFANRTFNLTVSFGLISDKYSSGSVWNKGGRELTIMVLEIILAKLSANQFLEKKQKLDFASWKG